MSGIKVKKEPQIETELYELENMPGIIIGRAVIDNSARMIGIVRNIKITLPNFKVEIIVKGQDVEIPIDIQNVENIGNIIQLKIPVNMESIDIEDVISLRRELVEEIKEKLQNGGFFSGNFVFK